jgi:hypothetical protein
MFIRLRERLVSGIEGQWSVVNTEHIARVAGSDEGTSVSVRLATGEMISLEREEGERLLAMLMLAQPQERREPGSVVALPRR